MTLDDTAAAKATPETIEPIGYIRLYIAGASPSSLRAQKNLQAALDLIARTSTRPNVEVFDVFEGPKRAIVDGVFVTPTLVVQVSKKRMMMVGDLGNAAALGSILGPALAEAG
jgi:circadian clock protein KaiB